jgi:hypothetical protein
MRLPTFRQRFSHHCIAYSLLMTSAASCLIMSNSAFAATATQRYDIAAGPLDMRFEPVRLGRERDFVVLTTTDQPLA